MRTYSVQYTSRGLPQDTSAFDGELGDALDETVLEGVREVCSRYDLTARVFDDHDRLRAEVTSGNWRYVS